MDVIENTMRNAESLPEGRRNLIYRETFDWSQGNLRTHVDIIKYLISKHPEWKSAFGHSGEMGNNEKIRKLLEGRLKGSRHSEVAQSVATQAHVQAAELFAEISAARGEADVKEIVRSIVGGIIVRDVMYLDGRPEKNNPRPLRGHGRKYQSFFCDYILLGKTYPGDSVWTEMVHDIQEQLPVALSDSRKDDALKLISYHNKWCGMGLAEGPIDPPGFLSST